MQIQEGLLALHIAITLVLATVSAALFVMLRRMEWEHPGLFKKTLPSCRKQVLVVSPPSRKPLGALIASGAPAISQQSKTAGKSPVDARADPRQRALSGSAGAAAGGAPAGGASGAGAHGTAMPGGGGAGAAGGAGGQPTELARAFEIDPKKLRMKALIGKGNFGEVWLATWFGSPVAGEKKKGGSGGEGAVVAWGSGFLSLSLSPVVSDVSSLLCASHSPPAPPPAVKTMLSDLQNKEKLVKRFLDEITLMSTLHHPNVVLFLGACTKRPNLCLVLEYCVHGSLHHFLKAEKQHGIPMTMSLIYRFALDIARGVYYLHKKRNVVQRDLKARNILVDESLNAKVADFGLSRVLLMEDGEKSGKLTACGTPAWTAPEIVKMER